MRSRGSWLAPLLGVMAVASFAAAGCGGDGGDSADAESNGLSSGPAKLVKTMAGDAATAKSAKDCKFVAAVNRRSPSKTICPPFTDDNRKAIRRTKLVSSATYGSLAAVVDYTSPNARKGASIVLYRNPKGQWTIGRWGLLNGPTVGTDDSEAREGSSEVVDRYLTAVRARDCESFLKYAAASSSDPKVACKQEFAATKPVADTIRADPDATPKYVGGNEAFGFYRLDVSRPKPASYVISTTETPSGALRPYVVLDVAAVPPAGDGS